MRKEMRLALAGTGFEGRDRFINRFARKGSRLQVRREPNNMHDPNAVGVWLECRAFWGLFKDWRHIGYVRASQAKSLAPLLDGGSIRIVEAVVAELDCRPELSHPRVDMDLRYESAQKAGPVVPQAPEAAPDEVAIVAQLFDLRWENLEAVGNGEAVSLWLHPDQATIYAYRQDTDFGEGLLGKSQDAGLARQIAEGLLVSATITKEGTRAEIHCRMTTKAAIESRAAAARDQYAETLRKPFRPRKLSGRLPGAAELGSDITEGDAMQLKEQTAEEYAHNGATLIFISERSGAIVSCGGRADCERWAKAALNGYALQGTLGPVQEVYRGDRTSTWKQLGVSVAIKATPPD